MDVTAALALKIVPQGLDTHPVFLCIDGTMSEKFGTKFEDVSKLFDHAAHNDSNYLNGHCFVSLMLCVPVWKGQKISYIAVPLGYRMWKKDATKLDLAAYMVRSSQGIEMLINLVNTAYSAMKLLPYSDSAFKKYRGCSVQAFRFSLSESIREQVFIASFVETLETGLKSSLIIESLIQHIFYHEKASANL